MKFKVSYSFLNLAFLGVKGLSACVYGYKICLLFCSWIIITTHTYHQFLFIVL